jgi:hypothetical protein
VLDLALAAALYGDAAVAFTFADPRIAESSGLASGSAPGVLYTHNDSGDDARFFAVGEDGRTRTTYVLPDVQARDWEDMARGPDEQGRSSLWLGDIGDNSAARERGILVHRVLEPEPTEDESVTTEPPTSFRLRYPDGPGDAEGLMVHPRTGRLYVVSKPLAGPAQVYAAPQPLDPDGPNLLERVAEARVGSTGTSGGPGIGGLAQLLVTAADLSPDGSRVAVRTYTDLYEWSVEGDDVPGAFDGEPVVTPLPPTRQGEGLAYTADGTAVLVSSEGAGAPVHRLVRSTAPAGQEPPAEAEAVPDEAAQDQAAQDEAAPDQAARDERWPLVAAGGALLAALLVVRGVVRRGRYRQR